MKYIYFNLNFNPVSRLREANKVSGMSKYEIRFLAHISKVERQQIFEGKF